MNFAAASRGVSIGNHLNRPMGRGIKPSSARGGLRIGASVNWPEYLYLCTFLEFPKPILVYHLAL